MNKPIRLRKSSLAAIDLRRISEAQEEEDQTNYKSPFFTLTAKDGEYLHYCAHLIGKAVTKANENVDDNDALNHVDNVQLRKASSASSSRRKSALVNVRAQIEDDTASNNRSASNSITSGERQRDSGRNSIFDIFDIPPFKDHQKQQADAKPQEEEPRPESRHKFQVEEVTEILKNEEPKKAETVNATPPPPTITLSPEQIGETTLSSGNTFSNIISLNRSEKKFEEQAEHRKSKYKFSLISDNESLNKPRQRRKSLRPSEAFTTSEEVIKARKLSIFATEDWSHKHNKHNQKIIIKRDMFELNADSESLAEKAKSEHNYDETNTINSFITRKSVVSLVTKPKQMNEDSRSENTKEINNEKDAEDDEVTFNMPETENEDDGENRFDTLKLFLLHICVIYGSIMSIVGIAVSISAVVTDSKNENLANNIEYFFIFLFLVSIIFMLFCLIDIRRCKINEKKNARDSDDTSSQQSASSPRWLNKLYEKSYIKDLVGKMRTKYDSLLFSFKIRFTKFEDCNKKNQYSGYYYDYKYGAGGLYLKVGLAVFCTVSLVNTALVIAEMIERVPECRRNSTLASQIIFFIFQFVQFCFIFKHSNLVIHNFKGLARIAVIHVVVTNLCVWIRTIIIETEEQYHHQIIFESGDGHKSSKNTETKNCTSITGDSRVQLVQLTLSPYLYPCTIEYAITCLAIFYIIWTNIGKKQKHFGYILKTNEMESIFNIDCHKTSRGLFCGIIVLLCTVVANIMYFIFKDSPSTKSSESDHLARALSFPRTNSNHSSELEIDEDSTIIIEVLELTLIILSGIVVMCAIVRTRRLAMIEHGSMVFDEVLVVLSLCGIYIFSVFSALSIIYTENPNSVAYLTLAISILSMIEGTLQTYLILDGLRRRAVDERDRRIKPARELFTLLIIVNVSLWISDTFAFKRFEVNPYQLDYYSVLAWSIINTISSPLAIFFRFHSSVCLSDCWKSIYL